MKEVCPFCMDFQPVKAVSFKEIIEVKGLSFAIATKVLECKQCKNKFSTQNFPNNAMELAHEKYRQKCGLLSPAAIKKFRDDLKLTQAEFSHLLGFGKVTISRYEGGAIQEKSHDNAIRMARTPAGMQILLEQLKSGIPKAKLDKVRSWVEMEKYREAPVRPHVENRRSFGRVSGANYIQARP